MHKTLTPAGEVLLDLTDLNVRPKASKELGKKLSEWGKRTDAITQFEKNLKKDIELRQKAAEIRDPDTTGERKAFVDAQRFLESEGPKAEVTFSRVEALDDLGAGKPVTPPPSPPGKKPKNRGAVNTEDGQTFGPVEGDRRGWHG